MIVKSECPRCGLEDGEASKYATLNNDRTAHVVCEGCGCLFYSDVDGNRRMGAFSEAQENNIEKLIHSLIGIDRDDARIEFLNIISSDKIRRRVNFCADHSNPRDMFIWEMSPQGWDYWSKVHKLLLLLQ